MRSCSRKSAAPSITRASVCLPFCVLFSFCFLTTARSRAVCAARRRRHREAPVGRAARSALERLRRALCCLCRRCHRHRSRSDRSLRLRLSEPRLISKLFRLGAPSASAGAAAAADNNRFCALVSFDFSISFVLVAYFGPSKARHSIARVHVSFAILSTFDSFTLVHSFSPSLAARGREARRLVVATSGDARSGLLRRCIVALDPTRSMTQSTTMSVTELDNGAPPRILRFDYLRHRCTTFFVRRAFALLDSFRIGLGEVFSFCSSRALFRSDRSSAKLARTHQCAHFMAATMCSSCVPMSSARSSF